MKRKNALIIASVIGLVFLVGILFLKSVQSEQIGDDETTEILTLDMLVDSEKNERLDSTFEKKYSEQLERELEERERESEEFLAMLNEPDGEESYNDENGKGRIKTKEIMVLFMDEINSQTLLTEKHIPTSLFPSPVLLSEPLEFGYNSDDDRIPLVNDRVAVISALSSPDTEINEHLKHRESHFGEKKASIVIEPDERVHDEGRLFLGEEVMITLLDGKAVEIELDGQRKKLEVGEQAVFTRKEGKEFSKIVFTNYGKWWATEGTLHRYDITDEDYDTLIKKIHR